MVLEVGYEADSQEQPNELIVVSFRLCAIAKWLHSRVKHEVKYTNDNTINYKNQILCQLNKTNELFSFSFI